jgi:hypothetical protein
MRRTPVGERIVLQGLWNVNPMVSASRALPLDYIGGLEALRPLDDVELNLLAFA